MEFSRQEYWNWLPCISPGDLPNPGTEPRSNEYSGLISLKIDLFDLLAVQRTLQSLHQYHNLKELTLSFSAFFVVQLSHLYLTTEKTIALTIWTFVSKVMSLLFNTLTRFVIGFLPRSVYLLISWLLTVCSDFEAQERKSVTASPFICHEEIGLDVMVLVLLMLRLSQVFQ